MMMMMTNNKNRSVSVTALLLAVATVLLCATAPVHGFTVGPASGNVVSTQQQQSSTTLALFGGLADALKNDDSLGKRENAGLKNVSRYIVREIE